MRKTYHFCLSSHEEVMFRDEADLAMGFNAFAIAALMTESRALGENFLTTHYHSGVQTDSPKEFMFRMRTIYSRYFNAKYDRCGRLGEKRYFSLEVEGFYHMLTMLNYILRQGLHHGLVSTPFEYKYGSVNSFFRSALGKTSSPELIADQFRYRHLPANVSIPPKYRMDKSGLLLREDILDTAYVEELYMTPRNFLFQMNKLTDEKDQYEQQKENDTPPVTMGLLESGVVGFDLRQALIYEQGKVNRSQMTDLELCHVIDTQILPRYFKDYQKISVYALPMEKRARICEGLWRESRQTRYQAGLRQSNFVVGTERTHPKAAERVTLYLGGKTVTENQLRRCLALL